MFGNNRSHRRNNLLFLLFYFQVTLLPLVPPVVVALNSSNILKKYDLSSVLKAGSGGAPLAKDTELEFAGKLGVGEMRQGLCIGVSLIVIIILYNHIKVQYI